jgi:hypothetical protein
MIENMQIIFDFKNSKEYLSNYTLEGINDKKIIVKNASPKQQDLGAFLLDFMDTDFDDHIDLTLFIYKYLFVHLLTIYDNAIITNINDYCIELDKNKVQCFIDWIYNTYSVGFSMIQINLEKVFRNKYYDDILKITDILSDEYDKIDELANNEKNYYAINALLANNNTTKINYDLNTFFINNIPENISTNYTFSSDTVDNFLYCIVKELISNVKNIKFECCRNCDYWFINKNSNEQKYCDSIFENNMTCNEIAKEERSKKNEKNDIYLQKCRKRYKNLHKQVSIGASERVENRFRIFKEQYPIYQERYKEGLITGEELLEWLECMKIRK